MQHSDRLAAGAAAAGGDAGGGALDAGGGAGAGLMGSTGAPPPLEPPHAPSNKGDASTPQETSSVTNDLCFMDVSTW
ncbi:hypothetical protein GmRootV15_67400 (plasmid) [Variovorax sp. V15]